MTANADLVKPTGLEPQPESLTDTFGRFVAEPLERGFGVTLGNALRRVILSSLQGAAFTGVRIEGVFHEFSSIPGVMEDVTEIILNLKDVVIDVESETIPIHMHYRHSGGRYRSPCGCEGADPRG